MTDRDADVALRAAEIPADVAAVFDAYPDGVRGGLLALRRLILDTAAATEGAGAIEETLKWGQPSYLTSETGSGSTIRIDAIGPKAPDTYAMFFICRTSLVETMRQVFGNTFRYEGNRALLFEVGDDVPEEELQECVAMALTYHR